jgi:uncharacterized membrane protein YeiH
LAAFSIIGVSITYHHLFVDAGLGLMSLLSCVLSGMITAFVGGVLRDTIMNDTPFAFRPGSNYALSSFLGALSFYLLMFFNLALAMIVSISLSLYLREAVSKYGLYKKWWLKR